MLDFGFYNMDCMAGMKQFPDKDFDLAIVDPPYDGGDDKDGVELRFHGGDTWDKYKPTIDIHRTGGKWANKYGKHITSWDVAPGQEYFEELFRISKNQIIWGGELF